VSPLSQHLQPPTARNNRRDQKFTDGEKDSCNPVQSLDHKKLKPAGCEFCDYALLWLQSFMQLSATEVSLLCNYNKVR